MSYPRSDHSAEPAVRLLTLETRAQLPLLNNVAAHAILRDQWLRSAALSGWFVGEYLLTPYRAHLFVCAGEGARPLAAWLQGWRKESTDRINEATNGTGPLWQDGHDERSFATIPEYEREWDYLSRWPVRAGLAPHPSSWPYLGLIWELTLVPAAGIVLAR